mgnify:CR=1 FL=1
MGSTLGRLLAGEVVQRERAHKRGLDAEPAVQPGAVDAQRAAEREARPRPARLAAVEAQLVARQAQEGLLPSRRAVDQNLRLLLT